MEKTAAQKVVHKFMRIKEKADKYNALVVVVTKGRTPEEILPLYEIGHRHFGENRVQEWLPKRNALPADILWHFIGVLQTNKVNKVVGNVELIHSVDTLKLLEKINKRAESLGIRCRCLLEVHIAKEESKHGFLPEEIIAFFKESKWKDFPWVVIEGLMGMASFTNDTNQIRSEFALLRKLKESIKEYPLKHLSMGMSNDWEIALDEGATILRIGTAIFS